MCARICMCVRIVKRYLHFFSSLSLWKRDLFTFWGKLPLCICNQSSLNLQLNSFMFWIEWMEMIQGIRIKTERRSQILDKLMKNNNLRVHPWPYYYTPCYEATHNAPFTMFYKSRLMYFSAQILLSLQACLLIGTGWNPVIPLFVFAPTVSVEQPMLVCLGVWELLSVGWCQSTGGSFMKWW